MDADPVEVTDATSNSQTNPKKRMLEDRDVDSDPAPKRLTRSSIRLKLKLSSASDLMYRVANGIRAHTPSPKSSSPNSLPPSASMPTLPAPQASSQTASSSETPTSTIPLNSTATKPKSDTGTAWASLLGKKVTSPPKSKTSNLTSNVIDVDAKDGSKAPGAQVTLNPYSTVPGSTPHPFFMTPEARKEHIMKENQQKLQSALNSRQENIRSQFKPQPGSIHSFFAPKPKKTASSGVSSAPNEARIAFTQYGTNLPDFPTTTHVLPSNISPSVDSSNKSEFSRKLQYEDGDALDPEIIGSQFSDTLKLYALHHCLSTASSESTSGFSSESSQGRSESPQLEPPSEEKILEIAKQIDDIQHDIRLSIGLFSSRNALVNAPPIATDGVALLDVSAKDMSDFLAVQQQAVAQREVAIEELILSATTDNPAYLPSDIASIYRVMLKQHETSFGLPWVSRYVPTRSSHICGNITVATEMKEWLLSWKIAADVQPAVPSATDFFKKRSPSKLAPPPPAPVDYPMSTMLIQGPTGSGKTSAVYAVAQELGFEVLEINSSMKRSGANLRAMIEEATQSRHVGRHSSTLTIPLCEEIDQQFPEDAGFLTALVSLCETSKRPIILTCEQIPPLLNSKRHIIATKEMKVPDEASIFVNLALACLASGFSIPPATVVHQLVTWFKHDLRSIFNNVQFWAPYLHTHGWHLAIRAISGLVPDPSFFALHQHRNCLPRSTRESPSGLSAEPQQHMLFRFSESKDLPEPLHLLHKHYLKGLISAPTATPAEMLSTLSIASRFSDVLSTADSWHLEEMREDVDTQREVQSDIRALLESLSLLVDNPQHVCEEQDECYAIGEERRQRNTEDVVNETLQLMLNKSGSRLSWFDDCTHLALLANIEDQQRLLNVKRRQFKFKLNWQSVGSSRRTRFVKALKLSPVPEN